MNSTTKICSKCLLPKLFGEFTKQKAGKFGLRAKCKSCVKEYDRMRYLTDETRRESMKARRRARYAANPESFKAADKMRREAGYFKGYWQRPEVKEKARVSQSVWRLSNPTCNSKKSTKLVSELQERR